MKIKKYIGDTMSEIMQQIRKDFGPDAVILSTKEIQQGGFLGFFKKKKLEVIAALDPKPLTRSSKRDHPATSINQEEEMKLSLLGEIQELKSLVQTQMKTELEFSPGYLPIYNYLLDQEVDQNLIERLIESVDNGEDSSRESILFNIRDAITNKLEDKVSVNEKVKEKIIHFVGPTGVGKTTTLAKIAAEYILKENKKIAFITTDTYRIAAIDQLKTYAKILNVPVEVAYSTEDYMKAIEQFSSYDYIFVDTAGRNFREEKFLEDLSETLNMHESSKTYLVLTLTAKEKDILDIFQNFKSLKISDIIFTKIDETTQYGSILNLALNYDVKIGYLTNGQDVPKDIVQPTADYITDLVLGKFSYE